MRRLAQNHPQIWTGSRLCQRRPDGKKGIEKSGGSAGRLSGINIQINRNHHRQL
jgi:hypothetical protein